MFEQAPALFAFCAKRLATACGFLRFVGSRSYVLRLRRYRLAGSGRFAGNLDATSLGLFALWQGHAQHSVAVLGGRSVAGDSLWQRERTSERTIRPLHSMVVLRVVLLLK